MSQVPGGLPLRRMLKVRNGIDRQISFMSNFFEIDFVMKIHAKKSRRFHLSETIFKCQ